MSEIAIPGFELEQTLGAGGFGTVWLARQPSVERLVAVKIGHRPLQDPIARSRFERECRALGRLSGQADIVDVHVAGSLPDGRPYLVMEYVDGGTLWDRIEQGPLSATDVGTVGSQICAALDHAHRADILHRDIKPENVFLRTDGSIVLGDFGIAAAQTTEITRSAGLTATIPYTAPEVLQGERATTSSDLYGVGATVLAAATRSVPFTVDTDSGLPSMLARVLEGNVADLRAEGYPDELASAVEWLMQPNPADRPSCAAEAADRFETLLQPADTWPAPSTDSRTVVVAPIHSLPAAGPATPAVATREGGDGRDGGLALSTHILLGAVTGVVLLIVGLGLRALTSEGDGPTDRQVVADQSPVAAPPSTEIVTTSTTSAPGASTPGTSATSAPGTPSDRTGPGLDDLPTITVAAPLLAPIDAPLSPADVGLPNASSAEFVTTEEDMGMCNTPIDLSETTEVRNLLINDFAANDQVAQQAIQFDDEAAAETFVSAVVASLTCRSWDEETVDGTGQRYTIVPVEIVPRRQFGDDTRAWESTITFENGFAVTQRSYMVRRQDRVIGLSVVSDDPGKIELTPTLMALMVDRLGYDT